MNWRILLHGQPKIGKTTLLETMPGPRLIIDVERGADWLRGPTCVLALGQGKPDNWDDPEMTSIFRPSEPSEVSDVIDWVSRGDTPYRSVALDSITQWQENVRMWTFGPAHEVAGSDWDKFYYACAPALEKMRALPDMSDVSMVAVTSLTREEAGGKPFLDIVGRLRRLPAQHFDTILYLREGKMHPDGTLPREMLFQPHGGVPAGDRTNRLGLLFPTGIIPQDLDPLTGEMTNGLADLYTQMTQ